MNKIYVVFECDSHRSIKSYCIKYMTSNNVFANRKYQELKKEYEDSLKDNGYLLNLAEYIPDMCSNSSSNILRNLTILKSTEI